VHPELAALVDRVRRAGAPVTRELEFAHTQLGKNQLRLHVRVAPLGVRFVLLLADDRTDSHRLDQVRRDFLANISHELKTPIGAIGLLAEAIDAASDEPDAVARFAERLTIEADRLGRLTHDIIELSRLQAAEPLVSADRVDIDSVVAQAVDHNRVAAESHGVSLVSGGDAGAEVYGDERLLVTAVNNLIANAIQYSPDGVRVGIGVARSEGIVEIAVTDQGVGIPEAEKDRVFERFFRVDNARSRSTGGTGLGLSIVKHAVQNHGGEVRVWSQPGSGSTFTIRLPEAPEAPARVPQATATASPDPSTARGGSA
jgi:two-component system sensor histidine kinase SenX3